MTWVLTSFGEQSGPKLRIGDAASFTLGDEFELVEKRTANAMPFSTEQASALQEAIGLLDVD